MIRTTVYLSKCDRAHVFRSKTGGRAKRLCRLESKSSQDSTATFHQEKKLRHTNTPSFLPKIDATLFKRLNI